MAGRLICIFLVFLSVPLFGQDFQAIDSTLKELKKSQPDTTKVALYNDLSWFWSSYDFKKALNYGNKALQLSNSSHYEKGRGDSYNMLAGVYDYVGKYDSAMICYNKSLKIRKKLGDSVGVANVYNNIGISFYFRRDYKNALHYYIKAARLREKINDISGYSQSLTNIGVIYRGMGDYENAIKTYRKTLVVKNKLGDIDGAYRVHINMGVVFQNMKKLDSALFHSKKALLLAEEINDTTYLTSIYINTGAVYKDLGNFDQAINQLKKAEEIFKNIDNQHDLVYCLQLLGECYYLKKQYAIALEYYQQTLQISSKLQRNEILQAVLLDLSSLYATIGEHEKAFLFQSQYVTLKDSLFDIENKKQVNELEAQFESELKEKEIARLAAQDKLNELEIEKQEDRQTILWITIVSIVILTTIILFSLFRRNRDNKKIRNQNNQIQKSLDEKEILLREIHHRVKNNLQVISGLLELQEELHTHPETGKLIAEAQSRIQSMALIHEMLYQTTDISQIDFQLYTEKMVEMILSGFSGDHKINKKIELKNYSFSIDTIIPLGLLLNELITNSCKYVFVPKLGDTLIITIEKNENYFILKVSDNGPGIKENNNRKNSFGLKLVNMLSRQLKGNVEYKTENGACFYIKFTEINSAK